MGATILITLRKGIEIALILSIVMAYLRKIGRQDAFKQVWIGMATPRKEYDEFHDKWASFEDGVKAKSQGAYTAIEDAIDGVKTELITASEPAKEPTVNALQKLRQAIDEQKSKLGS
jgi:high-affinity Fe2+/Pb2+ permease